MNPKITILMFHPRLEESRVNRYLFNALKEIPEIKIKDMYELYPDFNIDVKREQEDLKATDVLIFQHPFFWYAAPPLLKQWLDLVLQHGWAYGRNGDQLKDKKVMHIISSGGTFEAYSAAGKNRYTYMELLRPFELTYKLCGMHQLPPYIIPGANRIDESTLGNLSLEIKSILLKLIHSKLNESDLKGVEYFNDLRKL